MLGADSVAEVAELGLFYFRHEAMIPNEIGILVFANGRWAIKKVIKGMEKRMDGWLKLLEERGIDTLAKLQEFFSEGVGQIIG